MTRAINRRYTLKIMRGREVLFTGELVASEVLDTDQAKLYQRTRSEADADAFTVEQAINSFPGNLRCHLDVDEEVTLESKRPFRSIPTPAQTATSDDDIPF
jgi:hypothetical protein